MGRGIGYVGCRDVYYRMLTKRLKINVIKTVKCIPSYWKSLVRGNMSLGLCKTSAQLQGVYH